MVEIGQEDINARSLPMNDVSNPLVLNSSDNPGTILVTQVFDGTSYGPWAKAIIIAFYA